MLLLLVLSVPISNYFLSRPAIQDSSGKPRFAEVSKILQRSCADCHSPELTVYPIYAPWPLAKGMIDTDIKNGCDSFHLTRGQLAGAEPIGAIDLARIASVIQLGTMPPAKYNLLHWNAPLTRQEKLALLSYIQDRQEDSGVALAPIPEQNPFHPDAKKAEFGEKLFFDQRLSGDNSVSCASCHMLERGGADGKSISSGARGKSSQLNTPTVYNSAFNFSQFWDGSAADLNNQVAGSISDERMMGSSFAQVLAKLRGDTAYGAMSQACYHSPINESNIRDAIATYEKTLLTPDSAFDRYLRGDSAALSTEEKRGYELFMEKNCASCHAGVGLGGISFEKMGGAKDYFAYREKVLHLPRTAADDGRYAETKDPLDRGKFKVPLLRNIALTAPYFHDGSAKTLDQAVNVMAEYQTGKALTLAETKAIVAFLKSLTGQYKGKPLH